MDVSTNTEQPVQLYSNAVRIRGKSEIVLCASLFYFRIPRALWRERMTQLKSFGYNCIDVYFPWNYHELQEGEWDFAGEKDIEAFLQTAADVGLWVAARPGPYICSEWDGGALPAYLLAADGIKLRDRDPVFLHYVSKWYGRVLPIIQRFQAGGNGTVICVQLDNELDFYGCGDPNGYISALRDMAASHGITVPLIACAGQGGLQEASGFAGGVVPTCNFYPNDRDPSFEEKVIHYRELLASMGLPLMVTETNRSHFLLRRLLACGVKLLGPYLQVSGTDFGFTNATNNWGRPLAFLTSDYDFGGMISPEGHIREEAYEGKMLGRIIEAYGSSLSEASPAPAHLAQAAVIASARGSIAEPRALSLKNGGHLLFVSNVGEQDEEVSVEMNGTRIPKKTKLMLERGRSMALPFGVPLRTWGIQDEGSLMYATAELFLFRRFESKAVLVFHTESEGEVAFSLEEAAFLEATNLAAEQSDGIVKVKFGTGGIGACKIGLAGGHVLEVIAMDRPAALLIEEIDEDGIVRFGQKPTYETNPVELELSWSTAPIRADAAIPTSQATAAEEADFLETYGYYRGYAWYEASDDERSRADRKGILIYKGSDIVSLYAGREYVTTAVPGGSSRYVPLAPEHDGARITARVEIWGHTNFDDNRLPGLRLNAMKGVKALVSVTNVMDLTQNWRVKTVRDRTVRSEFISVAADEAMWPIVSFGGWLSPNRPALEYFRKSFDASGAANSWTVHFDGIQATARLFVNGEEAGRIDPSDPYADISPFVEPGSRVQMTVFLEKAPGEAAGKVKVYEGTSVKHWRISSCQEDQLWSHADLVRGTAAAAELPVVMNAGELRWLLGNIGRSNEGKGWRVKASGANMKLSVLFNGHLVGRLWLPGSSSRPVLTGGSPDSFYLPGPWFREGDNTMAVLLEALEGETRSSLDALSFVPV